MSNNGQKQQVHRPLGKRGAQTAEAAVSTDESDGPQVRDKRGREGPLDDLYGLICMHQKDTKGE